MSFECHLTFEHKHAEFIKSRQEYFERRGWKFSEISDDPILGPGNKCYLTLHGSDFRSVVWLMNDAANDLDQWGVATLRKKIERIVYDTATNFMDPEYA